MRPVIAQRQASERLGKRSVHIGRVFVAQIRQEAPSLQGFSAACSVHVHHLFQQSILYQAAVKNRIMTYHVSRGAQQNVRARNFSLYTSCETGSKLHPPPSVMHTSQGLITSFPLACIG